MPNSIDLLANIVGRENNPCFTYEPTQTYVSFGAVGDLCDCVLVSDIKSCVFVCVGKCIVG